MCTLSAGRLTHDVQKCTLELIKLWNAAGSAHSLSYTVLLITLGNLHTPTFSAQIVYCTLLFCNWPFRPSHLFWACRPRRALYLWPSQVLGLRPLYTLVAHPLQPLRLESPYVAMERVEDISLYRNPTLKFKRWLNIGEHEPTKTIKTNKLRITILCHEWTRICCS